MSMMSRSSTRMPSSYPVARTALNIHHAQLRCADATAAVQQSRAIILYILPAGLLAKLFQNLAARKSQTCCKGFNPSSAKRMSVGVLPLYAPLFMPVNFLIQSRCCNLFNGTMSIEKLAEHHL